MYLIHKNYCTLIDIQNWIIGSPMQSNFFRRSMDHKRHVNKKQNVETDSAGSSGVQENYTKYISFPWPPLEAALSVFNVSFLS
jgi:hypothetical protein